MTKFLEITESNFTYLDFILFNTSKTYFWGVVTPNAWKTGFMGGSGSCNVHVTSIILFVIIINHQIKCHEKHSKM